MKVSDAEKINRIIVLEDIIKEGAKNFIYFLNDISRHKIFKKGIAMPDFEFYDPSKDSWTLGVDAFPENSKRYQIDKNLMKEISVFCNTTDFKELDATVIPIFTICLPMEMPIKQCAKIETKLVDVFCKVMQRFDYELNDYNEHINEENMKIDGVHMQTTYTWNRNNEMVRVYTFTFVAVKDYQDVESEISE